MSPSTDRFTASDWDRYYEWMAGKPPRETCVGALDRFGAVTGDAVDLGCGEGRDAIEMLRRGWQVLAIDGETEAIRRIVARPDLTDALRARLAIRVERLEETAVPPCDFVNASFALPFCRADAFATLWERIVAAIRPGGRFAGQLFGPNDTWASDPRIVSQTRAQAEALLADLTIEQFQEEEYDGPSASDPTKHWHVFHIIARK
jgi:SAM-dependent methyltransferase